MPLGVACRSVIFQALSEVTSALSGDATLYSGKCKPVWAPRHALIRSPIDTNYSAAVRRVEGADLCTSCRATPAGFAARAVGLEH